MEEYVESRQEKLYQYSARQRREMERTTQDSENGEDREDPEDFYLRAGEQLDFS